MKQLKSFLYSATAIAAAIFGTTACSQDDMPNTPNREGIVEVSMSTSLPQELGTYAVNSAEGGLKNLEDKGYAVRYIMEIYLTKQQISSPNKSTERVCRMIKYAPLTAGGSYRTTSFNTRLLAAEYDFVFFADIVREVQNTAYNVTIDGLSKPFYANRYFYSNKDESSDVLIRPTDDSKYLQGDLRVISAGKEVHDNVQVPFLEMYDAYSCTQKVDLRKEAAQQNFTLKRPFAKLRLITTDANSLQTEPDWTKSRVDITDSEIPSGFNALTGESVDTIKNRYWFGPQALNSDIYSNETGNEKTISVFYLPIPENSQNLTFSINIMDASRNYLAQGVKLVVENVPLVANKLTTIKGNLLSKNATANITISDEFEEDETVIEYGKEASTIDALKAALTGKSESITYTGNITKANGFELDFNEVTRNTPVYDEGNTAELILKFPNIEENAVLTFKGGVNAPKVLQITTGTKCSLRINLPETDVNYDGLQYQYIITNSGCKLYKTGVVYNALFVAEAASFYSSDLESHDYNINANFTLPEGVSCGSEDYHTTKPCTFIETVKTWLNNNTGKTVWDFVGDPNN